MFPLPPVGVIGFDPDEIGADMAPDGIGAPDMIAVASKSSSLEPPKIFIFKLLVRLTLLLATLLLLFFLLSGGKLSVET